jgi:site-specific DNA-methyltransferase (adenine-specific)
MIIHSDCRDIPAELISQCDALITDPPYSDYVHENVCSAGTGGVGTVARDLGFEARTVDLMRAIAIASSQVARWSVIFSDLESTHIWRDEMWRLGLEYIREVPYPDGAIEGLIPADVVPQRWIRWSQPQKSGDRPTTGAEATLVFHRMTGGNHPKPIRKRWNGSGGQIFWPQRCLRGEDKHPTEKPLDLMLAIVSAFSDPGEAVYEPCGGSGTTALACRLLGRDCVSVELDEQWAAFAEARENAPLVARDLTRAKEWIDRTAAEARGVPVPQAKHQEKTYERAMRRLADTHRVAAALKEGGQ